MTKLIHGTGNFKIIRPIFRSEVDDLFLKYIHVRTKKEISFKIFSQFKSHKLYHMRVSCIQT